jgi:Family of unknown function (DUF6262)
MTDQRERLTALRRLDSHTKSARVVATLQAIVDAGDPITVTGLARAARVSRRFIYDHPELRAEAERRVAEIADRHAGTITASARVTVASLRADLANAAATNAALQAQLAGLRRRLGQLLGQDVLADMAEQGITDQPAGARLAELEQQLFDTQEELARRTDELGAARQINRELMARLNRERT